MFELWHRQYLDASANDGVQRDRASHIRCVLMSMPQIPIAIFVDRFIPGGTQRQMIELLKRIDRRPFRVHPVCFHDDGPWTSRVSELGDPIARFPIYGFGKPGTARQLLRFARWCRRERHRRRAYVGNLLQHLWASGRGARGRAPAHRQPTGTRRSAGCPSSADAGMPHCASHGREFARGGGAADRARRPGRPIDVIPNGIDLSMFPLRPNGPRPRKIAMVACLRKEKRIDVLIAAAPRVLARYPDVEFQIVGDGPCREQLVAQAPPPACMPRIEFMGHRDDVPAILSASDLFVLPSESEASPNVIFEAMAAGLPVVASRVGGIPELVADGVTGLLVPPGDSDALAAALLNLLDQPGRATAFGKAARECIEQQYSFERMVTQFETLYMSGSTNPRARACAIPRTRTNARHEIGGQERTDDDLPGVWHTQRHGRESPARLGRGRLTVVTYHQV